MELALIADFVINASNKSKSCRPLYSNTLRFWQLAGRIESWCIHGVRVSITAMPCLSHGAHNDCDPYDIETVLTWVNVTEFLVEPNKYFGDLACLLSMLARVRLFSNIRIHCADNRMTLLRHLSLHLIIVNDHVSCDQIDCIFVYPSTSAVKVWIYVVVLQLHNVVFSTLR